MERTDKSNTQRKSREQSRYDAEVDGVRGMIASYNPEHNGPLSGPDKAHLQYCREALTDLCIVGSVQSDTERRNLLRRNFVEAAHALRLAGIEPRELV